MPRRPLNGYWAMIGVVPVTPFRTQGVRFEPVRDAAGSRPIRAVERASCHHADTANTHAGQVADGHAAWLADAKYRVPYVDPVTTAGGALDAVESSTYPSHDAGPGAPFALTVFPSKISE